MLTPDASIVKELKEYEENLDVRWDNQYSLWQIWMKMPWGDKLITPLVESIYVDGGDSRKFCPLDRRIVHWVVSADTQRKNLSKKWRWLRDINVKERMAKKEADTKQDFKNIGKDTYNMLNNELISKACDFGEDNMLRPDQKSQSTKRVYYRSAENAKEYFDGNSNSSY
jgi:hypothetical protein